MDSPDHDLPWSLQDGEWKVELQLTAVGYSAQFLSGKFSISSAGRPFSQTAEWMELSVSTLQSTKCK
jgi:hypothetical protein